MTSAGDAEGSAGPWSAPENELRPFRPSEARAARERRSSSPPPTPDEGADWLEQLSTDLLEHISILSELVISTTDGTRDHVKALAAKVTTLTDAVDELRSEVAGRPGGRSSLTPEELDDLAVAVARRLQQSFQIVPPERGRS